MAPRKKQSEEQRREKRTKYDQKRRTIVKGDFDESCALVASIRNQAYSRGLCYAWRQTTQRWWPAVMRP